MKTNEWRRTTADGFAVNRAIKGEVFTENQMYIKKFADRLLKDLNDETPRIVYPPAEPLQSRYNLANVPGRCCTIGRC